MHFLAKLQSTKLGKLIFYIFITEMDSFVFLQASAGALLTQIEKEKELLRIFLRVSQMENAVLRRMNLPAFLMVRRTKMPKCQRTMKNGNVMGVIMSMALNNGIPLLC